MAWYKNTFVILYRIGVIRLKIEGLYLLCMNFFYIYNMIFLVAIFVIVIYNVMYRNLTYLLQKSLHVNHYVTKDEQKFELNEYKLFDFHHDVIKYNII